MNSEKIQNTKVEVPKGKNLNCKDYMNMLLTILKEEVKNYAIVLTEASNDYLYNEYKNIFDTLIEMQRETFNIMFRNGWYKLETAPTNKMNEKYNELNQELIDLNG